WDRFAYKLDGNRHGYFLSSRSLIVGYDGFTRLSLGPTDPLLLLLDERPERGRGRRTAFNTRLLHRKLLERIGLPGDGRCDGTRRVPHTHQFAMQPVDQNPQFLNLPLLRSHFRPLRLILG